MAIDEAILRTYKLGDAPVLRIYMWRPSTISIGYSQRIEDSVNVQNITRMGFNLVRRLTGGGALLHAERMELTYSIILPLDFKGLPKSIPLSAAFIADSIRIGLNRLGLPAYRDDISIKSDKLAL